MLHWFKSVCSDGTGWQWGSTLFQFYVEAEVCWVLFYSIEKLSVLMESVQFR